MRIVDLEGLMLNEVKPLIRDYQFKPYNEYNIEQSRLNAYVIDEVSDILSHEDNLVLVAEEMEDLVGLVALRRQEWDTKHFGIDMAKIEYLITNGEYSRSFDVKSALMSALLKKCSKRSISHLTARTHTEDITSIHALEKGGFCLMDTVVTYANDLRGENLASQKTKPKASCKVREFQQSDVDKLANIALESFKGGRIALDRFHADPSLPKEKSDQLYVEWIVNSCKGLADTVLVAEIDEIPVGYITCKVYKSPSQRLGVRFGSMIISAVSPAARQKGVYSAMFGSGLGWLADRVDIVEVGTQIGNYLVQRVWTKFGFVPKRSEHTFCHAYQKSLAVGGNS